MLPASHKLGLWEGEKCVSHDTHISLYNICLGDCMTFVLIFFIHFPNQTAFDIFHPPSCCPAPLRQGPSRPTTPPSLAIFTQQKLTIISLLTNKIRAKPHIRIQLSKKIYCRLCTFSSDILHVFYHSHCQKKKENISSLFFIVLFF